MADIDPEVQKEIRGLREKEGPRLRASIDAKNGGAERRREAFEGFDRLIECGPDWRAATDDEVPYLIPSILVSGGVAILAGEPKTGKTWLALTLGLAVANGADFLAHYPVETQGRVLYIGTEGSRAGARDRLDALSRGMQLEPNAASSGIDFMWRKPVRLDDPLFIDWLEEKSGGYALVVVDVLTKAWGGDENDNPKVGALLRDLERITRAGATVLLVHHFGKENEGTKGRRSGQRIRGASAFHAAVDSGLYLERRKDAVRTNVTIEQKDCAAAEPFTFAWPEEQADGTASITLDRQAGEATQAEAAQLVPVVLATIAEHQGESKNKIAERIPARKTVVKEAIRLAIESNQIHVRPDTPYTQKNGRRATRDGLFPGLAPPPNESYLFPVVPEQARAL